MINLKKIPKQLLNNENQSFENKFSKENKMLPVHREQQTIF